MNLFPMRHDGPLLAVTAMALVLVGCGGPRFYPVTGKVTLNAKPLPDAALSFLPESAEGSPVFGQTDAQGNYALQPTQDAAGALVGRYTVRISTYRGGDLTADPPIQPAPETVPPRYNRQSELRVEVMPRDNVFDFALESAAPRRYPLRH